jgi:hypothetical protein
MLMYAELMNKANDQIKHLRLTVEAWLQYSQRAERDIAEFRDELARITKSTGMGFAHNHRVIDRLTAERDEARRLLKAVVDMMRDNMAHDATHPHHLCDFIHRPDIGMCKVCEDWTDAMVMCYPDDFQDEEDGK